MRKLALIAAVLAISAVPALAAGSHGGGHGGHYSFGEPGKAAEVTKTVSVELNDEMQIVHDLKQVRMGDVIRFVVTNKGVGEHEFSVGDTASQRAHAAMMKKMPDMKHENDPTAVTLKPGETKEIIWKFNKPVQGRIEFSCQMPGHYEAGMTAKLAFIRK